MPWTHIPEPECYHSDRPKPEGGMLGAVWQCDGCGQQWTVANNNLEDEVPAYYWRPVR